MALACTMPYRYCGSHFSRIRGIIGITAKAFALYLIFAISTDSSTIRLSRSPVSDISVNFITCLPHHHSIFHPDSHYTVTIKKTCLTHYSKYHLLYSIIRFLFPNYKYVYFYLGKMMSYKPYGKNAFPLAHM